MSDGTMLQQIETWLTEGRNTRARRLSFVMQALNLKSVVGLQPGPKYEALRELMTQSDDQWHDLPGPVEAYEVS